MSQYTTGSQVRPTEAYLSPWSSQGRSRRVRLRGWSDASDGPAEALEESGPLPAGLLCSIGLRSRLEQGGEGEAGLLLGWKPGRKDGGGGRQLKRGVLVLSRAGRGLQNTLVGGERTEAERRGRAREAGGGGEEAGSGWQAQEAAGEGGGEEGEIFVEACMAARQSGCAVMHRGCMTVCTGDGRWGRGGDARGAQEGREKRRAHASFRAAREGGGLGGGIRVPRVAGRTGWACAGMRDLSRCCKERTIVQSTWGDVDECAGTQAGGGGG